MLDISNFAQIIGFMGKDPDYKVLENGAECALFSVATNNNYRKDGQIIEMPSTWHNIICWRFLAKRAQKFKKGDLVLVVGKISNRTYEKSDGTKGYTSEIIANQIKIFEGFKSFSIPGPPMPSSPPPVSNETSQGRVNQGIIGKENEADDLPF